LKLEEALDGVYILRTREKVMGAKEIIEAYKDLTDVERAFRTMKSSLELRPFYHRTEPRVKAHALVCYLAFLIERYVERYLRFHEAGFSARTAFESLSQLGAATMEVDGERYTYISVNFGHVEHSFQSKSNTYFSRSRTPISVRSGTLLG